MTDGPSSPSKEAIRLTHILDTFFGEAGPGRFPVDVPQLARECASIYKWDDPITDVIEADIRNFEGALVPGEAREKWAILYNSRLQSAGRIRFTQAHELGHYILHRQQRDQFQCSAEDMLHWSAGERDMEAQADTFASYLLMPMHDFRKQVDCDAIDLDMLGDVAERRYGVSLTAAILKWLSYTERSAVFVMSNDGFMDWAWSSEPAFQAGAYFAARQKTIEIPSGSLAANESIGHERHGAELSANIWFKNAPKDLSLREMKISADNYGKIMTLLILPRHTPRFWERESGI